MARFSPVYAICLAGPTGSGKTALALEIAEALDCEIINADSRQVYSDFPLITAQPSADDLARVPHHLYGYLGLEQKTSAWEWCSQAAQIAHEITSRGRVPLFVGGTGFYFQALLRGMAEIPSPAPRICEEIARRMTECGSLALHRELTIVDPECAARIHPHDRQRIQRALEVYAGTGRTLSWWHARRPLPPPCCGPLYVLDVSVQSLLPALARRIERMIGEGAREEVSKAMRACGDLGAPGWSGIGCREAVELLDPACDLEWLKQAWLKSTRAYAKRQITWFRGQPETIWVKPDEAAAIITSNHLARPNGACD